MPSIYGKGSSGQRVSSQLGGIDFSVGKPSSRQSRFGPGVGRVSVNPSKPETFGESLEGLGKGILGIVGAVPLVGGLAKGALEVGGGAIGAVGTAIGSFKPVETGPSVGDVVSGIPGAALDVISAPSKFVQKDIIAKDTARKLKYANAEDGFGNASEYYNIPGIKTLLSQNASEDEIAEFIYNEGLTFGAKPNVARDLALGMVTDPLTWVPFGAIASGAARAGALVKAVKAGEVLAASDAKFWQLWQPVGTVYNAVTGFTSGSARALTTALAGRAPDILELSTKKKNVKAFVGELARVSGPEADSVVSEASRLSAYTLSRGVKAGAARLISEQAALATRPSAQRLVVSISDSIADLKPSFAATKDKAAREQIIDRAIEILDKPIKEGELGLISSLEPVGFKTKQVRKLVSDVLESSGEEDLIGVSDGIQSVFQKSGLLVNSKEEAENILAQRARLQTRSAVNAGARELIASRRELLNLTDPSNIDQARSFAISALRYGLNRSEEQARQIFDNLVAPAINSGNTEDALELLDLFRAPAFGRLAEGVGTVRQTFDAANAGSRLTLISARSLSQESAKALVDAVTANAGNAVKLRQIVRDATNQYGDLYEAFGRRNLEDIDPATLADDFVRYLEDNKKSFVKELEQSEIDQLTPESLKYKAEAESVGYRLGIAPEDGVISKYATLTDDLGREYQTRSYSPYADLVDTVFVDPTNIGKSTLTYKRNAFQSAANYVFRRRYGAIGSEKVRNTYIIESNKIGLTQRESNDTLRAIRELADEQQVLPRGLALDYAAGSRSTLAKNINAALGKEAIKRVSQTTGVREEEVWKTVFMNVFKAYNGDVGDLGIMPKFTSWVKMKAPLVAAASDNAFPRLRFGVGAPQFRFGQENIEPNFFRFTSGAGVREERIAGLAKNDIRTRAIIGEFAEHNQVGDAQTVFMQAGNHAAIRIAKREPMVMETLESLAKKEGSIKDVGLALKRSILAVDDRKKRGLQAMMSKGMARRFYAVMSEESPELVASVERFLKTSDPEEVAYYLGLEYIYRTDPVAAQQLIAAGEKVGMLSLNTVEERRFYQNVVEAARKAAADEGERARRAIYFDPNRPFWERSLNHPLLALYPLSYMVGKVIPEFVRLMVKTPFPGRLGGDRLFAGVEALRYLSESVIAAEKYDPEFRTWIEDNPEAWLLLQWLVPYTPDNIGFGFSSTMRKYVITPGLEGEALDVGRIPLAAGEQALNASILGTWRMGFSAIEDVKNDLPDITEGLPNALDVIQGKN